MGGCILSNGEKQNSRFLYLVDRLQAGHLSSTHTVNILNRYSIFFFKFEYLFSFCNLELFFKINSCFIFMDNTCKTNKNRYVLSFLHQLVAEKKFEEITLSFLIAGHTKVFTLKLNLKFKFSVDSLFGFLSKIYHSNNVFSVPNLARIWSLYATVMIMTASQMHDWKAYLELIYPPFPDITNYHSFMFKVEKYNLIFKIFSTKIKFFPQRLV